MFPKLFFNKFLRYVLVLASGSAFAHLITLSALPIISRLYNETQFGELSFLVSASAVASILMTSKLELAFFNVVNLKQKVTLLKTVALIALATAGILFFILFICSSYLESNLFSEVPIQVLYYVPLMALLLAWYNVYSNFAISIKEFKAVAKTKVTRSVAQSGAQVSLFFFGNGLIIGEVVSRFFGIVSLHNLNANAISKTRLSYKKSFVILRKNINFIKWSGLSGVFNAASLQVPTLIIASLYDLKSAGIYYMTHRIVFLPSALLGQSLSQVFSSEFSTSNANHRYCLFNKVVVKGFFIGCVIFLPLSLFSHHFIGIVLGNNWLEISSFIVLLTPFLIMQFAIVPVSNTLNMLNRQSMMLVWDAMRFGLLVVLALVASIQNFKVETFLLFFSLLQALSYSVLWILSRYYLKSRVNVS